MRGIDLDKLARQIEPLTRFFYAMLAVALLAVLFRSPGSAPFFLVVGSLAQVLRASVQELLWQRQGEAIPAPARRRAATRATGQRAGARPDGTRRAAAPRPSGAARSDRQAALTR